MVDDTPDLPRPSSAPISPPRLRHMLPARPQRSTTHPHQLHSVRLECRSAVPAFCYTTVLAAAGSAACSAPSRGASPRRCLDQCSASCTRQLVVPAALGWASHIAALRSLLHFGRAQVTVSRPELPVHPPLMSFAVPAAWRLADVLMCCPDLLLLRRDSLLATLRLLKLS